MRVLRQALSAGQLSSIGMSCGQAVILIDLQREPRTACHSRRIWHCSPSPTRNDVAVFMATTLDARA